MDKEAHNVASIGWREQKEAVDAAVIPRCRSASCYDNRGLEGVASHVLFWDLEVDEESRDSKQPVRRKSMSALVGPRTSLWQNLGLTSHLWANDSITSTSESPPRA
jgi:hypothetical protein